MELLVSKGIRPRGSPQTSVLVSGCFSKTERERQRARENEHVFHLDL